MSRAVSPLAIALWRARCPRDVLAVPLDELPDSFTAAASAGPGILDRSTEPDIIANHIVAIRLRPQILYVGLLDLEVP